jgi:hypothetical protein
VRGDPEFITAKIHMLQALARSQTAIANMLEQTAGVAGHYQLPVSLLHEQLRSLAGYQSTMIAQLSGIQIKQPVQGIPAKPWLNRKEGVG